MATNREYVQSIMRAIGLAQNADDELLATPGVGDLLREMDALASELVEVLE